MGPQRSLISIGASNGAILPHEFCRPKPWDIPLLMSHGVRLEGRAPANLKRGPRFDSLVWCKRRGAGSYKAALWLGDGLLRLGVWRRNVV